MTDYKQLCAELLTALVSWSPAGGGPLEGEEAEAEASLISRARAALAQPEPEGPTDEELLELMPQTMRDDLASVSRLSAQQIGLAAGIFRTTLNVRVLEYARAVLARWGTPNSEEIGRSLGDVPPPADGEVAEVVRWLRSRAGIPASPDFPAVAAYLTRAADLLAQCHPKPVPVSERLPGPDDCDAEGRCWLLTVEDEYPQWRLYSIEGAQPGGAMIWVPVDSSPGVMVDCFYTSHWLPVHALPVPISEEVQS